MRYFPQDFCFQLRAFLSSPGPYTESNLSGLLSHALCSPYLNPHKLLDSLTVFGSKNALSDTGKPQVACLLPSQDVIPCLFVRGMWASLCCSFSDPRLLMVLR